jgi:hypothetical protein
MVPVLDKKKVPLMPCTEKRARELMEKGSAKPYWKNGIFCIILQREPSARNYQDVVIGIDPGSKRTGITIATAKKVISNQLFDTPSNVKKNVEVRRVLRKGRRSRKTPYRKCRSNRKIGGVPPSTKARWGAHLRVIDFWKKLVPITIVSIEDIKAETKKNCRKWNKNFSPLEVGKKWFECEVVFRGYKFYKFQGVEKGKCLNSLLGKMFILFLSARIMILIQKKNVHLVMVLGNNIAMTRIMKMVIQ